MNIPYGRQSINAADIKAVSDALIDDFLTQGPRVEEFENALCSKLGATHGVAVNSATSALHLACMALDVTEGDLVWTSAVTFVASANCARYCGADVDFVDIDPNSYNMSPDALSDKLQRASQEGRLPKVVIPVHLTGQPCDMEAIHELSKQYGFSIIEDASHATGAVYKGSTIGSCEFSDIAIFSFHPVKIITTGEGGAALTNSAALAARMRNLRSHGITRNPQEFTRGQQKSFYYEQQELGYNYRLTDFQAALGLSQLSRLDSFLESRRKIAQYYDLKLANLEIKTPKQGNDRLSAWHLYVIRVGDSDDPGKRDSIFEKLREKGIAVNLHYIPVYRHPYYLKFGYETENFPQSESYFSQAISIPIHPELTRDEQDFVIDSIVGLIS